MMVSGKDPGMQHEVSQSHRRVGLVTPFFLPDIGGANIYCFELARALSEKGYDVHLFTIKGALEDSAYTVHPVLNKDLRHDLEVLQGYDMDIWHVLFFFYAPLAFYKENVFVTGHGDDCFSLNVRYRLATRDFIGRHLLWRLGGRPRGIVLSILDRVEIWKNYWLYYLAMFRARHVITVSNFTRTRLTRHYPGTASRVSVIPPGVSERFFSQNEPGSDSAGKVPTFLTVTRLDEQDRIKNVHGVIGALAGLKQDYAFRYRVISGSQHGNYRDELERQIRIDGLENMVTIEGRKSDQELVEIYNEADLFILVSYAEPENFEGFGIVFLEANASGIPVLSSREGGMSDYIVENDNGFYVEDPSADGIRSALKKYFDGEITFDPERIRQFPEPFRWASITDRIIGVYDEHGTHA